ncbi:hypothetical protein D3C72_1133310 [compost metagenome]
MQAAALKGAGQFRDFPALAFPGHTEAEHRVDFIILNVQQSACAREFAQQAHAWRTKQRRHHANNAIRLPATLGHQREETAQSKASQMQQAF